MKDKALIVVRGAGDLATGVIHRLWRAGYPVLALEALRPAAIRRKVALCEAVYQGSAQVEDLKGLLIQRPDQLSQALDQGAVPQLVDPAGDCIAALNPACGVDAILAKKNLGTHRGMAGLTIALGPGFQAGVDVDYVVETNRGHDLGRIIAQGFAQPNTGTPGVIAGYGAQRVIHAPAAGAFRALCAIGDLVQEGQPIAQIYGEQGPTPVPASLSGLIRGIIRDGYPVFQGMKIADIDPRREQYANCFTISDKARCISGSVLELVCRHL